MKQSQGIEQLKEQLFEKEKKKGLFWSYAPSISYHTVGPEIVKEQVLKYGDFDDISQAFVLYGTQSMYGTWEKTLKPDVRFKKLNLFLARIFFDLDIEADYFTGGMSEREKKLRIIAERNTQPS